MKTLTIFRHAKSSWEFTDFQDHERPLLPKGEKRTKKSCSWLSENQITPDLIVTSPAVRADQTARIILKLMDLQIPIQLNSSLYPGTEEQIIETIEDIPNKYHHVFIVGHNPGVTDVANFFLKDEIIEWMPTSGFATLQFDTDDWAKIDTIQADLAHYIEPKNI